MDNRYAEWAVRWRVPLGFALGAAYLIFSRPSVRLMVVGGGVAVLGLLVRAWAAGFLDKDRSLATGGPYACTRNPLYLGSALIGLGFALAGGSWTLAMAFVGFFLLVYWPVMRREEQLLRQQFGGAYEHYAGQTPSFFPVLGRSRAGGEEFRWERYRKNREYEAALGSAAGIAFLILKIWLR